MDKFISPRVNKFVLILILFSVFFVYGCASLNEQNAEDINKIRVKYEDVEHLCITFENMSKVVNSCDYALFANYSGFDNANYKGFESGSKMMLEGCNQLMQKTYYYSDKQLNRALKRDSNFFEQYYEEGLIGIEKGLLEAIESINNTFYVCQCQDENKCTEDYYNFSIGKCENIIKESNCVSDLDCNDKNVSTRDYCDKSNSCYSLCMNEIITKCAHGDGYCPAGCTVLNDDSCKYKFTGVYDEQDLNEAIELGRKNRLNPEDTYADYYVDVQGYNALIITPYLLVAYDVANIFHDYGNISYEKKINWSRELDTNTLFITKPLTTIENSWEAYEEGKSAQEIFWNIDGINNIIIKDVETAYKVYKISGQNNFMFDCLNEIHNKTAEIIFIYPEGEYSVFVNFNEYK